MEVTGFGRLRRRRTTGAAAPTAAAASARPRRRFVVGTLGSLFLLSAASGRPTPLDRRARRPRLLRARYRARHQLVRWWDLQAQPRHPPLQLSVGEAVDRRRVVAV